MTIHISDWIQTNYDDLIITTPEGMKVADAYTALAPQLATAIANGEVAVDDIYDTAWAKKTIRQQMTVVRDKRSRALSKVFEEIADALMDPENGITIWPFADTAYRTGHPDGIDKALRYWTSVDVDTWVDARVQAAKNAMAAAQIDVDVAARFKAALDRRGVAMLDRLERQPLAA